jgi:hypothetical protein
MTLCTSRWPKSSMFRSSRATEAFGQLRVTVEPSRYSLHTEASRRHAGSVPGAREETRTPDLRITSALLFRLSYPGGGGSGYRSGGATHLAEPGRLVPGVGSARVTSFPHRL